MAYYFEENPWSERYLPEINRDTFKNTKSGDVYDEFFDFDLTTKDTLHVFVGSDSGLLLKHLEEHLVAPGSCAIVIENDELTPYIEGEYPDLSENELLDTGQPRIRLSAESNWLQGDSLDAYNSWFFKQSVVVHRAHCCFEDYNSLYTKLYRETRRTVTERGIRLQQSIGIQRFFEIQCQNAADNVTPFPGTSDFGNGSVAIVLAGGPSLAEHMDWILNHRDQLFIIAVSRLCAKLMELDLKPDLVVSIDPERNMYDVSKMGVLWKDVPLVNGYHLTPELLQQWQGPHYFIGERLPWDQFSDNSCATIRTTGPTVSHTAVIVASTLGFSTILMAGADLCFSALGGTHVDGTPESALRSLPSGYDAQVTTYSGRIAGTSLPLVRSIDSMRLLGEKINLVTPTLHNLSDEAAKIDSIPLMAKQDVMLPQYKPAFDASIPYTPTLSSLNLRSRELQTAKRAFRNITELCKKAIVCLDYIYECNGRIATPAHHKRLKNLESKLTRLDQYTKTIKHFFSGEFLKLQTPAGFQSMKRSEMETWARAYYDLMKRGAIRLSGFVDGAQDKVAIRKKELADDVSVAHLLGTWKADNTPGRILKFSHLKDSVESDVEREAVCQAMKDYKQSLHETGKLTKHLLTDTKTIINDCINSVMFLHSQENSQELLTLSSAIHAESWPNNALVDFITALVHEIASEQQQAISLYQRVIDSCHDEITAQRVQSDVVERLMETSLIRKTQCYLAENDGQQALEPLEQLSASNLNYLCSYARLLGMLNQTELAIEHVQQYLNLRPNDWRAARQLSDLYRAIGANESADLALQLANSARSGNQSDRKEAA